jgi:rhamnosyltransferase subunit B
MQQHANADDVRMPAPTTIGGRPAGVAMLGIGSAGDVHPFIAVGAELARSGVRVRFISDARFADLAVGAGLTHVALGGADGHWSASSLAHNPSHTGRTAGWAGMLRDEVIPRIPGVLAALRAAVADGAADVIVSPHTGFGAPWVAREAGVPWVMMATAPASWCSLVDPPMYPLMPDKDRYRPWLVRMGVAFGKAMTNAALDPAINKVRRAHGLSKGRAFAFDEMMSADLNLGLWSPSLRGPASDDLARSSVCGFAWFDRGERAHSDEAMRSRLRRLTDFLSAGEAPIVMTTGTAVVHVAQELERMAASAAWSLGKRLVILSLSDDDTQLERGVLRLGFLPHSMVFPHARVILHHGGMGTTAQALRSGRPGVIVPFAMDQFDNARRSRLVGASITLRRRGLTSERLAAALARAEREPGFQQGAMTIRDQLLREDGAIFAAAKIRELLRRPVAQDHRRGDSVVTFAPATTAAAAPLA